MEDLSGRLEQMSIGVQDPDYLIISLTEFVQRSLAPQVTVGATRPCEEKDFREYRPTVEANLKVIGSMLECVRPSLNRHLRLSDTEKLLGVNLLFLIGENSEQNIWNTKESVMLSEVLLVHFCSLYNYSNVSRVFLEDDTFVNLLCMLRPKLLKDTWKTYPAAVTCYKWILQKTEKPTLFNHIENVMPTTLIILDDYVPDNVIIGLECLYLILQHSSMKKELVDIGYSKVIYHALTLLTHRKEVRYVIPVYSCIASLLLTMEYWDNNDYDWTARDDVICILTQNMQFEQNIELRHAYMLSLPQLLVHLGSVKWCGAISCILVDYCEHHTDLRTLKATLKTAKTVLSIFHPRVAAHSKDLYTAFLKLHLDLTETPVLDRGIVQDLEDCIRMLYELSPDVGRAVMNDNRISSIINLSPVCQGDIKYFE